MLDVGARAQINISQRSLQHPYIASVELSAWATITSTRMRKRRSCHGELENRCFRSRLAWINNDDRPGIGGDAGQWINPSQGANCRQHSGSTVVGRWLASRPLGVRVPPLGIWLRSLGVRVPPLGLGLWPGLGLARLRLASLRVVIASARRQSTRVGLRHRRLGPATPVWAASRSARS